MTHFKDARQQHFMSNIPVRITDKYRPVETAGLLLDTSSIGNRPSSLVYLDDDVVSSDYNFSTERHALEHFDEYFSSKFDRLKQAEAKLASEQLSRRDLSTTAPTSLAAQLFTAAAAAAANSQTYSSASAPALAQTQTVSTTMTPRPSAELLLPSVVEPRPAEAAKRANSTHFLDEFDAVSSSPFDIVALKSLNDIEELRSVLAASNGGGGGANAEIYVKALNST